MNETLNRINDSLHDFFIKLVRGKDQQGITTPVVPCEVLCVEYWQ
jgi:hypothetical protein